MVVPLCERVVAVDISREAIARAQRRLKEFHNIEYKVLNIRDATSLGTFDLVVLGEVLYYLGDARFPQEFKAFVGQLAHLVAPGGRVLLANHLSAGRSYENIQGYEQLFMQNGFRLSTHDRLNIKDKQVVLSLLEREH